MQHILLFLFFVSAMALGVGAPVRPSNPECGSRIIANGSVRVPISRYQQPYARAKNGYFGMLGDDFAEDYARRLLQGGPLHRPVFMDLGSGISLTGLQWVQQGGQAVAVSAHDFWETIDSLVDVRPEELEFYSYRGRFLLDRARGISIVALKSASIIFGVPFDEYPPEFTASRFWILNRKLPDAVEMAKRVSRLATHLRAKRRLMEDFELFFREIGLAEELLPHWKGQVDLLADVYGAFFYSSDRRYIVELVYQALKVGGRAYLFYRTHDETKYGGPYDKVRTPAGNIDFLDFLCGYDPDIFKELEAEDGFEHYRVLQINKVSGRDEIELPLQMDERSIQYVSSTDGYSFAQRVIYDKIPKIQDPPVRLAPKICISIPSAWLV
ncbi:MAG: hypothetical protein R3B54_03165 [Bdellovibrionota bacterium]